jgi:hypothetical protein
MNGWEFFRTGSPAPATRRVPVVVYSSAPDSAPPGVTRVLRKPVAFDRLLSTVREFCAQG